jgi:hypothetical protein
MRHVAGRGDPSEGLCSHVRTFSRTYPSANTLPLLGEGLDGVGANFVVSSMHLELAHRSPALRPLRLTTLRD